MIHYTCDCCKRPLDPENELRYVVRLEVYAALDQAEDSVDEDRDHLQEIQDILEHLDEAEDACIGEDIYQSKRLDLCSQCRRRFVENPLGLLPKHQFDFSEN